MAETSNRSTEGKIVVSGGYQLHKVWPDEAPELSTGITRLVAEIGDIEAVISLLAAVAGEDADDYRLEHGNQIAAVRSLTAHCRAAILRAALQVEGDLTPEAVLAELRSDLRRPIDPLLELLAS